MACLVSVPPVGQLVGDGMSGGAMCTERLRYSPRGALA